MSRSAITSLALAGALLVAPVVDGAPASGEAPTAAGASAVERRFGIQPVSLRLTAGGTMVDFRYRVLDAAKAKAVLSPKVKPYLLEPRTGTALESPEASKLGPLRSSARNPPVTGKQYFVLFANGLGTFTKGARLTVVLGDCRLENLVLD